MNQQRSKFLDAAIDRQRAKKRKQDPREDIGKTVQNTGRQMERMADMYARYLMQSEGAASAGGMAGGQQKFSR